MNQLEELLHDAGGGPVRFDHRDIARRARHRRRTRLTAVATVVAVCFVAVIAGIRDDDQVVDSVGPVEDGAVTVDELVADRWVARAYSAVVVPPDPPAFLDFGDDGRLGGVDGCRPINGTWELDGARLVTALEPTQDIPCANETGGLVELLEAGPSVGRFGTSTDMVQLTAGDDFVAFERFDRLGEEPTQTSIDGTWTTGRADATGGGAGSVTFAADGTARLEILGCSQPFEWSLEGDALAVEGLDRSGVPCDGGVVGGVLLATITAAPRLRVDATSLWTSSDLGVAHLWSDDAGSDPAPTTTTEPDDDVAATVALDRAARSGRFVTASSDGVTLHDGDHSTRIADGAAAVAFAVGSDIVVHQPASTDLAAYPPSPEGSPVAWISGERQDLPVDPDARGARLLDAAVLDGVPVALVAESHGGVGPDDTFEELVLIDVEGGTRTTVVRRPAWESAHLDARLLPDGDVVGLFGSESLVLLARWSAGADEALWTTEVGADGRPTLAVLDEQISVIEAGFSEDFEPVLRIGRHGLDGTDQGEETVTVADPAGALGAGVFCSDWHDAAHLLCGRSDGPAVLISPAARAFEELVTAAGAYPTAVRPG